MKISISISLSLICVITNLCEAQIEIPDTAVVSKIKKEGMTHSSVMNVLSMLTDVHGPRLTNSSKFFEAADYAKKTLESWGLQNVHSDIWDENFGRGWELKKFTLQLTSPTYAPLIAYPKAWSPGIKGNVKASVIFLDVKKEEDLGLYKGKLNGKIVLFSQPVVVKPGFAPDASRLTDSTLLVLANGSAQEPSRRYQPPSEPQRIAFLKWELCRTEGALAVVEPSQRFKDNIVSLGSATVPYSPEVPYFNRAQPFDENVPKVLPQIAMGTEHYNMLIRQIQSGLNVEAELTFNAVFTEVKPGINIIGEIPGTDLKDEVVMIGAHLDSWHTATGTTDNAVGAAVMMEAVRILKTLELNPRRTIRIALWGGEEQGLLGSDNYVRRVLGKRIDKTYPYDSLSLTKAGQNFSVYFNSDLGSGKFRGIYLQGNESARVFFRTWLKPFEKLGTATITSRNITGTDHLSFDAIGLPAFQFIQDPLEYGTTSYHSNLDVYEKAVEADLKHNASVVALLAWMAANTAHKFPRK
jgi:carboxypeptidase Q